MVIPREAQIHMVTAVVRPDTRFSSLKITPAPTKPIPVIILAAIRSGLPGPPRLNESIVNIQDPNVTNIMVLNPADFS
ncbi:hypothetical protein D3C71_732450 [compost metagenome]